MTLVTGPIIGVGFILLVSLVVGVSYSILLSIGGSPDLPMLGLSGVVMGVIGLSAYLMPRWHSI